MVSVYVTWDVPDVDIIGNGNIAGVPENVRVLWIEGCMGSVSFMYGHEMVHLLFWVQINCWDKYGVEGSNGEKSVLFCGSESERGDKGNRASRIEMGELCARTLEWQR
jgi:hypothetical protein